MTFSLGLGETVWYDKFRDELYVEELCPITNKRVFITHRSHERGGNFSEFGQYILVKRTGFEFMAEIVWDFVGEL